MRQFQLASVEQWSMLNVLQRFHQLAQSADQYRPQDNRYLQSCHEHTLLSIIQKWISEIL